MSDLFTVRFRVYGIVQGVGFRPTVDRHAHAAGIRGSVCNKGPYVEIIAQGSREEVDCFRRLLTENPPRRASILKIDEKCLEPDASRAEAAQPPSTPDQPGSAAGRKTALSRPEKYPPRTASAAGGGTDRAGRVMKGAGAAREGRPAGALNNEVQVFSSFSIIESEKTEGEIYISPDIAICEDCIRELYDPADRRYLHPFINCTCCGPRLTILDALPYDRERTSMKMFPMCRNCAEEYHSPLSRRYDAQPVCCNDCGPEVYLLPAGEAGRQNPGPFDGKAADVLQEAVHSSAANTADPREKDLGGSPGFIQVEHQADPTGIPGGKRQAGSPELIRGREAITAARRTILAGGIVAVKGIGGFHLCCDASNEGAVRLLRTRKRRPAKPFAVMMRDEEAVRRECELNAEERRILTGHQKPILLLERKAGCRRNMQETGAPAAAAASFAEEKKESEDCRTGSAPGTESGIKSGIAPGRKSGSAPGRETGSAPGTDSGIKSGIAPSVAPGNPKIGVMLPYAPLQSLLFDYDDGLAMPDCLVMTSGNVSGAPICRDDEDALRELSGFCDCILSHDRMIRIRADDTVMDFHRGQPYMIRRSRGYAPLPVMLTEWKNAGSSERSGASGRGCVLAVGGELKNTFCIASGDLFYLSPYVGDLEDLRTVRALQETIGRMETLLEAEPAAVVCDLHPKYNSAAVAEDLARRRGIPLVRIQHHYAHVLSCMAENDFPGPVIGVSFDGTGYGTDGTIWGGEILLADAFGFSRRYSIAPFTQAGGDSAPRQGWRIAASMLWDLCKKRYGKGAQEEAYFGIVEELSLCDVPNAKVQRVMTERGIQAVRSTSAGRLFDAVSTMLGICRESTYEGEASIALEFAARRYLQKTNCAKPVQSMREEGRKDKIPEADLISKATDGCRHLPTDDLFASLLDRRLAGEDPERLALDFHAALAGLIARAVRETAQETGVRTAALTGGCFQNGLLLSLTEDALLADGIRVLLHHLVPPNDGGIALGQAAAVMARNGWLFEEPS